VGGHFLDLFKDDRRANSKGWPESDQKNKKKKGRGGVRKSCRSKCFCFPRHPCCREPSTSIFQGRTRLKKKEGLGGNRIGRGAGVQFSSRAAEGDWRASISAKRGYEKKIRILPKLGGGA